MKPCGFALAIVLGVCASGGNAKFQPITVESSFKVEHVDETTCKLTKKQKRNMKRSGFIKVICPFNVLITGNKHFPGSYLKYTANIVARLLDKDQDGEVDVPEMLEYLSFYNNGKHKTNAPYLVGAQSRKYEQRGEQIQGLGYGYGLQTYSSYGERADVCKRILTEEAFHMIHADGWGNVYPEQLGVKDFTTSVICREMARIECTKNGWYHPENKCPGAIRRDGGWYLPENKFRELGAPLKLPLRGTCNDAGCDCAEFYHQTALILVGATPGWYGPTMPRTAVDMRNVLSDEFLEMFDAVENQQISSAGQVSGVYSPNGEDGNDGEGGDSDLIGGCILRTTPGNVPANLYTVETLQVSSTDERYLGTFKKKQTVFGITSYGSSNNQKTLQSDFCLVANTITEMLGESASNQLLQREVIQNMYLKRASNPMFVKKENFDFSDEVTGNNSICDVIYTRLRRSNSQVNEVLEHLLHYVLLTGLSFAFPQDWGLEDVKESKAFQVMQDAIDKGYYNVDDYEEEDEAVRDRILVQEFHWWLTATAWGLFKQFDAQNPDEWKIRTWKQLGTKLPEAKALHDRTTAAVLVKPNDSTLKNLKSLRSDKLSRRTNCEMPETETREIITCSQADDLCVANMTELCQKYCGEPVINDLVDKGLCKITKN